MFPGDRSRSGRGSIQIEVGTDNHVPIRVAWSDSVAGGASRTGSRLVRTDDGGRFTVCGIPSASRVQALVGTGRYGRRTGVFMMPDDGFLSREFTYVLPDAPIPDAGADTARAAKVPEPDSARYVLPPLEVPIPPETVLEAFRRRRENRQGHFFTGDEITETDPTWLSDVFRNRGIFEVNVEFEPDASPGPYRIGLFDPDSGRRTWCRPNLVVNGRPVPRAWSLNDFLPEEIAAMEVYWIRNETPLSFRQGVAPDLARLGAGNPAFRGGEAEGPPTSRPVSDDFFRDCGAILLWTRSAVDSTG